MQKLWMDMASAKWIEPRKTEEKEEHHRKEGDGAAVSGGWVSQGLHYLLV